LQLLPPPPEGAVYQPLAPAEVADGQLALLLIPDRPPPEPLPGGITSLATAFPRDEAPSPPTLRSERIVPRPSRWGPYDGYSKQLLLSETRRWDEQAHSLNYRAVKLENQALIHQARKFYGSWDPARAAARV
jgi:hypothetical protein